ncbi:alpha-1,2-fucosyltransferase [Blastococcus sp. SYSU D00669]
MVGLVGGLGNQLFQYAFARWLEVQTGLDSYLDLSAYRKRPDYLALWDIGMRRLPQASVVGLLPHPMGRLPKAAEIIRRSLGPRVIVREVAGEPPPEASALPPAAWYYGYWQHPQLLQEVLPALRAEVARPESLGGREEVAMHVRRGDMLLHVSALAPDYYPRALEALTSTNGLGSDARVAVYSDDPDWCRQELRLPNARYVVPGNAAEDMIALSRHRYLVLSGSTFSWWAASLSERPPMSVAAPAPFSMVPGQRLESRDWVLVPRSSGLDST